ncbi:TPA: hypothetical protein ACYSC8_004017, partial [Citrobacter freundii]
IQVIHLHLLNFQVCIRENLEQSLRQFGHDEICDTSYGQFSFWGLFNTGLLRKCPAILMMPDVG